MPPSSNVKPTHFRVPQGSRYRSSMIPTAMAATTGTKGATTNRGASGLTALGADLRSPMRPLDGSRLGKLHIGRSSQRGSGHLPAPADGRVATKIRRSTP